MIHDQQGLVAIELLLEGLAALLSKELKLLELCLLAMIIIVVGHLMINVLSLVRMKSELPITWLMVTVT